MNLQIPKKYIISTDAAFCVIAAPAGIPELEGYVMRIPKHLVTGKRLTILIRHGNEKTEDGKTCRYMLEKDPAAGGSPSQPLRYTTAELQALYDRAESEYREISPESLTGPGRLVKAAYAAPVPGTRLKREKTAWFVLRDGDSGTACELAYTPLRGHPVKELRILEQYRVNDISALLAVRDRLPDRPSPDDIRELHLFCEN